MKTVIKKNIGQKNIGKNMRARNLKPGFFKNEELAEIEPLGRILFQGLWCMADRAGRLEDRPKRIKIEALPYDNCNIEKLLNLLQQHNFIFRYQVNGQAFIQVVNFTKHQSPHIKESESTIPAPDLHQESTIPAPDLHGSCPPESFNLNPDSLNPELKEYGHPQANDPARTPSKTLSKANGRDQEFPQFWQAYPRKTAKPTALSKWRSLAKQGRLPPLETLLAAVEAQKRMPQWDRDGVIPHPATWLNGERWNDEVPEDPYAKACRLVEEGQA